MATPNMAPLGMTPTIPGVLPLPFGWTEHVAPTGQIYYFHASTNQSTYTRPFDPLALASASAPPPPPAPTKKEKPLYKIPIPNTPWVRVKTTHDNVFFTRTAIAEGEKPESVWSVPDEIASLVAEMDWPALEEQAARDKEVARLQKEISATTNLKRPAPDEPTGTSALQEAEEPKPKKRKRRAPAAETVDLGDQAIDEISISAPIDETEPAANEEPADEVEDDGDDDNEDAFSTSSAEEAWQREMAEGLSKLAEEEAAAATAGISVEEARAKAKREQEEKEDKEDQEAREEEEKKKDGFGRDFKVPAQVNLSPEEARALFKTLLSEKNPSPLAPFTTIMPLLITDPRYVLLPSQAEREAAFNEWCRDKAREKRLAKSATSAPAEVSASPADEATGALSKEDEKVASRHAFDVLLKHEVTSTRTTWDDFRRKWKKDRRFFAFSDDREREKVFRSWVRELGERKREQARKAEVAFMELLKTNAPIIPITVNSLWKDVKRPLVKDPRYDAVGSSTLREELFNTFLKALTSGTIASIASTSRPEPKSAEQVQQSADHGPSNDQHADRKARAEKALRERETQARQERSRVEKDIGRSKAALDSAEAEGDLMGFYVDAVRDPLSHFYALESTFAQHSRFSSSPLPTAQKRALFHRHIAHLREKYLSTLHALFNSYSPLLSSTFADLTKEQRASLDKALPSVKLGLTCDSRDGNMRREWESWQARRTQDARAAFQALLEENTFVDFWGKVGKLEIGDKERAEGDSKLVAVADEDLEMGEMGGQGGGGGDDEEGGRDLKTLAKGIGEEQIERVLKNDQRYRAFDHVPEQRMRWIKNYLSSLSAPSLSVHTS